MYKYISFHCSISLLEIFKCLENQNFLKYGKYLLELKKRPKLLDFLALSLSYQLKVNIGILNFSDL